MNARRLAVLGCVLFVPGLLFAQKREDILSIQRDVAQLQDQVKQLQDAQDKKMAALQALVQQAVDQSTQLSNGLNSLQKNLTDRLGDQQIKVVAPVATLGVKVDEMSNDIRSIRENVADLTTRLGNLDNKISDISSAVRTLSQPSTPPPPPGSPNGAAAPTAGAPAGVSADSLWQNAFRDYSSGKDQLAMMEFADYLKYFPMSENAPNAQFYMGQIYYRVPQYEDAAQAFDAVLERFPENPKTPDALYMKGMALMKAGRKTDAASEFKDFLDRYPTHSLAPNARQSLKELSAGTAPRSTTAKAKKKQ